MKRFVLIALVVASFIMIYSTSQATVISDQGTVQEWLLPANSYTMPDGYATLATQNVDLDHAYTYTLALNDFSTDALTTDDTIEIVFRGIYNWVDVEFDNILNVYIKDGNDNAYAGYYDNHSTTAPDWTSWTHLGSWTYVDRVVDCSSTDRYDVAFILDIDDVWLARLTNGNGFTIGFDPDCHYYGDRMEVNAPPVPEPGTLVLLGCGLLGLAGLRKKITK